MKLKVAILGLGDIGHRFGISAQGDPLSHSSAYFQHPDIEVIMGIDPDLGARSDFNSKFPQAIVYENIEAFPGKGNPDIVSICSPTAEHLTGVKAALNWGAKVILCEKPIAPSIAEAELLVAECARCNCILIVNYSRRWTPMLEQLHTATRDNGPLGHLRGAALRYNGGLNHNGTHWIDMLLALFGPVADAYCLDNFFENSDSAESIAMRWDNGFKAYILSVHASGFSIGEGEFWGDRGMLRYSDGGQRVVLQQITNSVWPGYTCLGTETVLCNNGLEGHISGAIDEAARLARTGGISRSSGTSGLEAMRVVEMARKNRILQ
jgi:predicted dehydrogenase